MWYIWIISLLAYLALTWRSLLEASSPSAACEDSSSIESGRKSNCFHPAIRVGDELTIQLEVYFHGDSSRQSGGGRWISIDTCRIDVVIPASGKLPTLLTDNKKNNNNSTTINSTTTITTTNTTTATSHPKQQCEVVLPAFARHRSKFESEVKPLKARFLILNTPNKDDNDDDDDTCADDSNSNSCRNRNRNRNRMIQAPIAAMTPFFLTRIKKREPTSQMMRLLWNTEESSTIDTDENENSLPLQDSTSSASQNNPTTSNITIDNIKINKNNNNDKNKNNNNNNNNTTMWIPYLKFGRAPIRIRFVTEDRGYAFLQRADGIILNALNRSFYAPMMYIDELSLEQSAQIELAPFENNKPPIKLQIKFGSLSPMLDTLNRQVHSAFEMIESNFLGEGGSEIDEIRYFLQDERLYRFALTNIISSLHMWFDYLAFRDEVKFYKGRQNLSGVSTSTVITRMMSSLIILLYLIDGGGTNWVVLVSLFSSFAVEVWKVLKILQPRFTLTYPFVTIRQISSKQEHQTAEYDRIACRKLSMVLYPLVFGWSVYALKHYEYRSVYSWFISNLANAVYMFGFICLCPQLYVNYRMKSVAHLPWKVFMYKIFSTFVDDAFAWLIEMPLKHRLMTLRDDVVFLMFLVQAYLYRVDKTRSNEFGYSYQDESGEDEDKSKEKEINYDDRELQILHFHSDKESTNTMYDNNHEKLKEE
jgi:hypothetical protein